MPTYKCIQKQSIWSQGFEPQVVCFETQVTKQLSMCAHCILPFDAICHVFQLSSCLGVTCFLYLRSPLSYLFFLCSLPSSSLACREDPAICTISLSLRRHACLFCTYQRTIAHEDIAKKLYENDGARPKTNFR